MTDLNLPVVFNIISICVLAGCRAGDSLLQAAASAPAPARQYGGRSAAAGQTPQRLTETTESHP